MTPAALWILGIAGSVTAVAAALSAFAQKDLKRILAYSTVSQLALMVTALAVGGRDAAVFHLMAHGGFKALLFLAAGVVIHHAGTGDIARAPRPRPARQAPGHLLDDDDRPGGPGRRAVVLRVLLQGGHPRRRLRDGAGPAEPARLTPPPPSGLGWLVLVAGIVTVILTAAYCLRTWYLLFGVQTAEKETAVRGAVAGDRAAGRPGRGHLRSSASSA